MSDTYVYGPVGGKYWWRCMDCGYQAPDGYRRRTDADIAAEDHSLRECQPTVAP